jgi:uncharacterized protein (DUF58 family)
MRIGRLLVLIVVIFAGLVIGLATNSRALLVLAVLPVIYLAAALLTRPGSPDLEVVRTLSATGVKQGEPVQVTVRITNRGTRLGEMLVEDRLPPMLEVLEGEPRLLATLKTGGTVELSYTVRSRRGTQHFDFTYVTLTDAFGVFEHEHALPAPADLLVLPQIVRLHSIIIRPMQTRGFAGHLPARMAGSGVNFYGLREYQLGDPPRRINWRVSARAGEELYTNAFEQERIADVGILLDARQHTNLWVGGRSLFDCAIEAAASLADVFLRDGNRVGLMIYGYGVSFVFPGYGKVQRERILHALANAGSGRNYAMEKLSNLPTRLFPAKSQIVMISPTTPDDFYTLTRMRSHGYEILLVSPNPVAFDAAGWTEPEETLGLRFAQVERDLMLQRLRRSAIRVVDWDVDQALDATIHEALIRQPPVPRPVVGVM